MCRVLQANPPSYEAGLLKQALAEWKEAQDAEAQMNQSAEAAGMDVEIKSKAYQDALDKQKQGTGSAGATKKSLQDKAAEALTALDKAKGFQKLVDIKNVATQRVEALTVLLSAAAGGTPNTSDEKLKKAAAVAQAIP